MEPIFSDQIQHYLDISDTETPEFANASSLLTFTPTFDKNEYAPTYMERSMSPKFRRGGSYTIETQVDAMSDDKLHGYLMSHEHSDNITVKIVRVKLFEKTAANFAAEQATFSMNVSPLQMVANEPVKINAMFDMTSGGWTSGTWNDTTKTFTAAAVTVEG